MLVLVIVLCGCVVGLFSLFGLCICAYGHWSLLYLGYYSLVSFAVYGFGLLIDVCVCLFNSYGLLCCICLLIVFGFWADMIWWL